MKKFISIILTIALLLCACGALAEATNDTMRGQIEDGSYVIRIPVGEDMGWYADDMAENASVVKLNSAEVVDGEFIARYDAVADGTATISVRHYYTGFACDEQYTWDLLVKDGAVSEVTGGSYTANVDSAELDPYLIGTWTSGDARMTIEKNPGDAWDVEIEAPDYVFKTTVYQDCVSVGLIYDKGKLWDVPAAEDGALGEASAFGMTGAFALGEEEENLTLTWKDDQNTDLEMTFHHE